MPAGHPLEMAVLPAPCARDLAVLQLERPERGPAAQPAPAERASFFGRGTGTAGFARIAHA